MEQDQLLENGEVMLEKVRKHWIVYVQDFLLHTFGCFFFMVLAMYLTSRGALSFIDKDSSAYIGMVLIMFVIIFWTSFFYAWTKNYLDVWYVTDRHIIAINQKQMFEREEAFMELTRIQDVLFDKNGLLSTWFGYGKLRVQTAGIEQEFIIEDIHDVEAVAHRIMELRDKVKKDEKVEIPNN
jgi:uncharacterized membrane protein YdbT with pleckstrin-like domain